MPAIFSMVAAAVYNVADRIFVGKVNSLGLTAVGITMPLQIVQMIFVMVIGSGSATLISIYMGREEEEKAGKILLSATIYIIVSLLILTLLSLHFLDDIFAVLKVSKEVYPMAKDYIAIILLGGVPGLTGYCLNSCVRALGYAKEAMFYVMISSVLNIVLDYFCILVWNYGVKGAAVATVISQTLVTVFIIFFFRRNPLGNQGIADLKKGEFLNCMGEITWNGMPTLYMQVFGTLVVIILNRYIISYGGDYHLASITLITSISHFFMMVVYGVGQGTQAIFGYNYGARKAERTNAALKLSLGFVILFMSGVLLSVQLVPEFFISFFTNERSLIEISVHNIRIYLSMLPMVAVHSIVTTYLQSIKRPKVSTFLYILRYGAILIPTLYILPERMGTDGVYLAYALSEGSSGLIALFFAFYFLRLSPEKLYLGEKKGKKA